MNGHHEDRPDEREREQAVSVLRSELIRHILSLPEEARAKLLAFLHLVQDQDFVDADLQVDPAREVRVTMVSCLKPRARPRRDSGSAAEPLQ